MIVLTLFLIALLLFFGLKAACAASQGRSFAGRRTLKKLSGQQNKRRNIWAFPPLKQLSILTARAVLMDEATASRLERNLEKANLPITPQEYTARKYLIVAFGIVLIVSFSFLHFYFGSVICLLLMVFALMKQRDVLDAKIRKKERVISQEMPRFVRSICRGLQSSRDLENVIGAYRKVAGMELGGELDILLAEMQSGNI
ncbi:MAG: hypothetical protein VB064_10430, partial [Oscillospiraceae bacterium]|nr:hypothetical protein [Oscillospiraceae bacterium]